MSAPERPKKADAEDRRFFSKSHFARIVRLAVPSRSGFSKWDSLILDTWMWEIISMTFSTLCFLAIVGIMRFYDRKEIPSFPQGLTLNAIISILATGSKSSLLCMIGTSVGQLKWLWFSGGKKRPLYDLQSFDDVTRGPWGSIMVLMKWPHKGHLLISLGAIITIVSSAFDPFTQQILKFSVRQAPSASSVATAKQSILPWIPMNGGMEEAILYAIDTGVYSAGFELDPVCPSGNCTWLPFQSAGWCSKCEDVTSQATLVGCDITSLNTSRHEAQTVPCNITFPDGSWINSDVQGFWNETILGQVLSIPAVQLTAVNNQQYGPYLHESILGINSPVSAFAFVELEVYNAPVVKTYPVNLLQKMMNISRATECVLSPCVRTYNVSVTEGVSSIQASLPNFGEIFRPENYPGRDRMVQRYRFPGEEEYEKATACWKPEHGTSADVVVTEETWPITSNLWNNDTKFSGCPVNDYLYNRDFVGTFWSQYVYNASEQTWQSTYGSAPESGTTSAELSRIIDSDFAYIMGNVAASMTWYAHNLSNQMAYGTVYESQAYVSVDWAFLTLPAALISFGIVFLVLAIIVNSRKALGLWKSSLLPVIYHGLTEEIDFDEFASISSMERKAKETKVKLEVSSTGMRMLMV
ncbi:hypothetical protein BDV59DRAFT_182242 [Aspergillus ambiguus]|uniref:DUF3176 domain-containing protein n=1 Tax=Aspergillus ambiguus TaxID=176160 RepID=UPI003CCCEDAA